MKRAANEDKARSTADDSNTPDQGGPEQPSDTSGEVKGPPRKKSKQRGQASTDQTNVDEGLETASISRPEGNASQGENSRRGLTQLGQGEDSRRESAGEAAPEDDALPGEQAPAAIEDSPRMAATEFPAQLMSILQRNVAPDALWFMEGGEAIGLNRDLIGDVLLNHFRGMKFNSLVRNLNRWGFRRISHNSLTDKDRGYHHLLFQRDNPHLIHKMRRDASANDVVRHLDSADSTAGEESAKQEEKSVPESERTQRVPAAASLPAVQQPQLPGSNMETPQPVHPSIHRGALGNQHLMHGMTAQQLQWQRQQDALAAMQLGVLQSSNWGGLGSWNIAHSTLPSSSASALAFGLQQHQHHHQQQGWQTHAAAQQANALLGTLQRNVAGIAPSPSNPPASATQGTNPQLDDEEDSNPSAKTDKN